MYAVGRLGSYISGGLYTVSGPFHVFGGAVDIVVVEQQDGSFKSSPWYVRFGKFQGVLKGKEKVVNISVNGVDVNFQMYLDERGQAYFLKEVEGEEEDSPLLYPSSCDEMDGGSQNNTREMRSKSCNYYANESNLGDQIDANIGKAVARTNSRQPRILGLVFGRQSMRKKHYQEGDDDGAMGRISSWDRAEIAANLLEVQWSTNLAISKRRKDAAVLFSVSDTSNVKRVEDMLNIDEQGQHRSSEPGIIEASLDHPMLSEPTGSCDGKVGTAFQSGCEGLEYSVEESYIEMQSLSTREKVVEPSITCESVLEQKCEMISVSPRNIDEPTLWSAMHNDNAEGIISVVVTPDPQIPPMPEACSSDRSDEEQASEQRDVSLTSFDRCEEKSGSDRDQAFMHCETTETSTGGMEGTNKENHETLHLPDRGPAKTHLGVETLHATAKLLPEDTSYQKAETIEAEMEHIRSCHDCCQAKNPCPRISGLDELNIEKLPTESKPYAQMVTVTPIFVSVEAVAMAQNVCTIESFSKPDHCSQSEKCESVGDSVQFYGDRGLRKAFSTQEFESSQDEHFLFSDLDEYKLRESRSELNLSVGRDNEDHSSFCLEGIGDGSNPVNNKACSSTDQSVQEDQLDNIGNLIGDLDALSKPIGIPKVHGVARAKVERPVKSLPIMWSCTECLDRDNFHHPLSHSVDSHFKSQDWNSDERGKKHTISVDADNENQSSQEHSDEQDTHVSEGHRNGAGTPGEPPKEVVSSDGNWRLWPFSRKKSRSRKTMQPLLYDSEISNSETVSDINIKEERDSNVPKSKGRKEMVKAKTPTSEQLALLNLKEGSNTVTFTFSTAMLGKQKVDARIYLWKWNTRIVISDVDGTITKSDVLGQFMPLVGVDWSQIGVAHLFSAIKENGYQLLFLSARAISQAYLTRQFLINLKQDGKALPDGPVVISPDGLFPSLFREVIRRTPHEFKIACLEDIRALFPHDCNPFYAGFGNRDTDEISYLKVGIPRGKIFIINPKGEVAVNRRVDTKSYTSLHALVDDMFPPAASSEQEDFNTWNYWKLPPPVFDN